MDYEAGEGRAEPSAAPDSTNDEAALQEVLQLDHVYDALGHPRRRYLCYTLLENTVWSLSELAAKIAAWENDIPEDAVTEEDRERVYVSLYHTHIPRLVEAGVVAFDAEEEALRAAENAEQVLRALDGMGASLDAGQEDHARGVNCDDQ
jgi:hypothetical protein